MSLFARSATATLHVGHGRGTASAEAGHLIAAALAPVAPARAGEAVLFVASTVAGSAFAPGLTQNASSTFVPPPT